MAGNKILLATLVIFVVAAGVAMSGCTVKVDWNDNTTTTTTPMYSETYTTSSVQETTTMTTENYASPIVVEVPKGYDSIKVTYYFVTVTDRDFERPLFIFNGTESWNYYRKYHYYHGAVASYIGYRKYLDWSMVLLESTATEYNYWAYGVWNDGNFYTSAWTYRTGAGATHDYLYRAPFVEVFNVDGLYFTSNVLRAPYYTTWNGRYWLILRFMGMEQYGLDAYGTVFVPLVKINSSTYMVDPDARHYYFVATDAALIPSGTDSENVSIPDFNNKFSIDTLVGDFEFEPGDVTGGYYTVTATFYRSLSVPTDLTAYYHWYWSD